MKKKLPTAQKLPSGTWRCQVMVDGKRVSVVADTPGEAQARAVALKAGLIEKAKKPRSLTVGEAIDHYIESKDAVLSPATIAGYKRIRKNALLGLMDMDISEVTQENVQRAINGMAKNKSPKSVRNAHGLLSAALSVYRPEMMLRTTLPQKKRNAVAVPSGEDIEKILSVVVGTEMELPVLLAIWMGLRVSEIIGLTWDCVEGDMLHVKAAIVDGEDGPVEKGTKTYSGDRRIRLPEYLNNLICSQPKAGDHIIRLSRRAIGGRFDTICRAAGIQHYRFHDLRHANASVMLALGVPDKYAMERMGHATNNMLKTVYQHTMRDKQDQVSDVVDDYFIKKLHTDLHTKSDKP